MVIAFALFVVKSPMKGIGVRMIKMVILLMIFVPVVLSMALTIQENLAIKFGNVIVKNGWREKLHRHSVDN